MPTDPATPEELAPPALGPSQAPQAKGTARPKRPGGQRQTGYPVITRNRLFAGALVAVIAFMFLALIVITLLSFFGDDPPTQFQSKLFNTCHSIITTCLGTVLGLVGGRASRPDTIQPGDEKSP
jgi:hypothetical protein